MKKIVLLFTLLLFSQLSVFAQSPNSLQCTMNLDDISLAQTFNIDHPKQEDTRSIATGFISELTIVYDLVNQNNSTDLAVHLELIQLLVDAANTLGMNYSMFQADLDFIETLN